MADEGATAQNSNHVGRDTRKSAVKLCIVASQPASAISFWQVNGHHPLGLAKDLSGS